MSSSCGRSKKMCRKLTRSNRGRCRPSLPPFAPRPDTIALTRDSGHPRRFVPVQMALCCLVFLFLSQAVSCQAFSSSNIPLDSPLYLYLEKLSGFGLINSDIKGIKPFSKAEAARLVLEAENSLSLLKEDVSPFATDLIQRVRKMIPREILLKTDPGTGSKTFDYNLLSALRLRSVWLDGTPRNYQRQVHDPGGD